MAYNTEQRDGESLESWYRRLAKTADQRLVRLESYQHDLYYKTATEWAYSKAQRDIKRWSGENASRFNTAPPEDPEKLIAKINDIRAFIDSPTSTKQGITNVYKKKADTVNENYQTNFTWEDLAKYYDSGIYKVLDALFGSKTALKIMYKMIKLSKDVSKEAKKEGKPIPKGKDMVEEIKQASEQHAKVSNNLLDQEVERALNTEDIDIKVMF